jgi:hypothetical protein
MRAPRLGSGIGTWLVLLTLACSAPSDRGPNALDAVVEDLDSELLLAQTFRSQADLGLLASSVLLFAAVHGSPPAARSIHELVQILLDAGMLDDAGPTADPWGNEYRYARGDRREEGWAEFVLVGSGANGKLALGDPAGYLAPLESLPAEALSADLVYRDGLRISRSISDDRDRAP